MQRPSAKWRASADARAARTISRISASIAGLGDEDLLDLHDIFRSDPASPLDAMATAEIRKRNLVIESDAER